MNISQDQLAHLKDRERGSFSLNNVEKGIFFVVGVAAGFALWSFLHSSFPASCGPYRDDHDCSPQQIWDAFGKPLFLVYGLPFVLSGAISGVFLLRSIRRDVRQFSMIANLAFSIPMLAFIGLMFYSILTWCFLGLGPVLALLATVYSGKPNRHKWDWVSLPFNLIWIVIFVLFLFQYLSVYGD
jgi:hypothetical protein